MRVPKKFPGLAALVADRQSARGPRIEASSRLSPATAPAANPGNLRFLTYAPEALPPGSPLVVVLHGCTQNAADYDRGSGWSRLADQYGFSLLFPEQQRSNNQNLCFNWFEPGDTGRGKGEAASIAAMVDQIANQQGSDSSRIFITGLSAGGAMSAAMLSLYPERFAGGAIVAGLPFGCAGSVADAFACMGGRSLPGAKMLADRVRAASAHKGRWPKISVWHGSRDATVSPANSDAIVAQWLDLHGLPARPSRTEKGGRHIRRVWSGPGGSIPVEQYVIAEMGHGTPVGSEQGGQAGPHMLDAGIHSTAHIASFWGIAPAEAEIRPIAQQQPSRSHPPAPDEPAAVFSMPGQRADVQKVIEDALKSAGLLR